MLIALSLIQTNKVSREKKKEQKRGQIMREKKKSKMWKSIKYVEANIGEIVCIWKSSATFVII